MRQLLSELQRTQMVLLLHEQRLELGSTLVNYASQNRGIAANIMHLVFSTTRGSGSIPSDLRDRIDSLHELLGLKDGQCLLDTNHPVVRECDPEIDGGIPRVFPFPGKEGRQVIHTHSSAGSNQEQFFMKALGAVYF